MNERITDVVKGPTVGRLPPKCMRRTLAANAVLRLSVACTVGLLILALPGCRTRIDETNVIKEFTADNVRYAIYRDHFSELKTTVTEYQPPRTLPIKRYCLLRSGGELSGGYTLRFTQRLEIDSKGKLINGAYRPSAGLSIESPEGKVAKLTPNEFDDFLEADDPELWLAKIGVDFSQPDLDEAALLELVRVGIPEVERMMKQSPDARAHTSIKTRYRSSGRAAVFVSVDSRFTLHGTCNFRLGPGGESVTPDSTVSYTLWDSQWTEDGQHTVDSHAAGWAISLTTEEYETLIASDNRDHEVAKYWKEHRPDKPAK
jgi:hypothetical protein